jgi:hypothetical protein
MASFLLKVNKILTFFLLSLLFLFFFPNITNAFSSADILGYFKMETNTLGTKEYFSNTPIDYNILLDKTGVASTSEGMFNNAQYLYNTGGSSALHWFSSSTVAFYNDFCSISTSSDFSISFWYKKGTSTLTIEGHVISMNYTGGTNITFHHQGVAENLDTLSINLDSTGTREWTSASDVFTDTNWHQYVLSGTWGSLGSTMHVYKDNAEISGSWNNSSPKNMVCDNSLYTFEIGARGNQYGIEGYVDDVAYYNKILSNDERILLQTNSIEDILNFVAGIEATIQISKPTDGQEVKDFTSWNIIYTASTTVHATIIYYNASNTSIIYYDDGFHLPATSINQNLWSIPKTWTLNDGDYIAMAYLFNEETNELMATSSDINFSVSEDGDEIDFPLPDGEIATSTLAGQLVYGGKVFMKWLFLPSQNSVNKLSTSYESLKEKFPFNVFFGLLEAVDVSSASATVANTSFSVPFITATGTFYMHPVLTASSVPNLVGDENNILIRSTISWGLWLIVALIIFKTFKLL